MYGDGDVEWYVFVFLVLKVGYDFYSLGRLFYRVLFFNKI